EGDALQAKESDQRPECVGIVHERINVKSRGRFAVGQVTSRIGSVIDCDQFRANVKGVLDATNGERKRASAVGKSNAQFREPLIKRSSSRAARSTSCKGIVPRPTKRFGFSLTTSAM